MFTNGGEYTLTSGAYRSVHNEGGLNAGALNLLHRNDIIQTGQGCFMELYLEPGGTRIYIVENTALAYKGPGKETLSVSFELVYGRIRISSIGFQPQGDWNAVFITTGEVETVFRRGDAGIDYIVNSDIAQLSEAKPLLTIYNFSGKQELWPRSWLANTPNGTKSSTSGFVVNEYEAMIMETANSLAYIERKPLDNGIIHYWNRNNISGSAPFLTPRSAALSADTQSDEREIPPVTYTPQGPPVIIEYIFPDNPFDKRLFRVKNFLLSTGMIFTLGGVGMQIMGSHGLPSLDDSANKVLFNFGYVPFVIGLIFNGAALVINPQNMEKNGSN